MASMKAAVDKLSLFLGERETNEMEMSFKKMGNVIIYCECTVKLRYFFVLRG